MRQAYEFGPFRLDPCERILLRDSEPVALTPKVFDTLVFLVENAGCLIAKDKFMKQVWADTFVEDATLAQTISQLRKALGDSDVIETVPKKGYRFLGAVRTVEALPQAASNSSTSASTVQPRSVTAMRSRMRARLWVWAAVCGVLLTVTVFLYMYERGAATRSSIHSLAVLPLQNLSGDPNQEYFADGMTEALITELGKISGPRVISRQSVMEYKGSKKSLRDIARQLNVDAVLEGAVGRSGNRVKVTVHLAQVSPERQLWTQEYDRSSSDVLSLQGEIARAVTHEIRPELTTEDRTRLSNARPVNPEAHADYLRGRVLLAAGLGHHSKVASKREYTDQDIQTAIAYFKSAIDKDPAYAQAYAGLADAYIDLGNPVRGGHSPKESLPNAKEAATMALKLDPSLPEAHFSLAQTLEYDWKWPEAEKEYQLALKLNPNYADAHLQYGRFVQALGRNDEALTEMHYADELDPFNLGVKETEAYVTYASRQYDLALKLFETLGDDVGQVWTYREKGMYPEALVALERWKLDDPQIRHPHVLATLAGIYGLEGRKEEAEKLIDELKETARHRYVSGVFFAEAYVGLGQSDQAINSLERAYEEHDQSMVFANAYPGFDRLRAEPRFQALMRRMNFPQ